MSSPALQEGLTYFLQVHHDCDRTSCLQVDGYVEVKDRTQIFDCVSGNLQTLLFFFISTPVEVAVNRRAELWLSD